MKLDLKNGMKNVNEYINWNSIADIFLGILKLTRIPRKHLHAQRQQ